MTNRKTTYNATSQDHFMGSNVFFHIYAMIFETNYLLRELFKKCEVNFEPLLAREVSVAPSATLMISIPLWACDNVEVRHGRTLVAVKETI